VGVQVLIAEADASAFARQDDHKKVEQKNIDNRSHTNYLGRRALPIRGWFERVWQKKIRLCRVFGWSRTSGLWWWHLTTHWS